MSESATSGDWRQKRPGHVTIRDTLLAGLEAFEKSSLGPLEREVLAMTMGHRNGCQFCLNLHRRMLKAQHAPAN